MRYRVFVIGTGAAGAKRPEGNHAAAAVRSRHCELLGVYDRDPASAAAAAAANGCLAFESVEHGLANNPDIVVLAVHPENRAAALETIWAASSVQAILCEKPLAYSGAAALQLLETCQAKGKRLYVNYQRRVNGTYQQLAEELKSGRRGTLQNAIFYYTRGMWANASHWVDLSLMLFGRPQWAAAQPSPIPSPYKDDPNALVILGYENFNVQLVPLLSPEKGFFSGNLELIFDRERLYIPNVTHYKNQHIEYGIVREQMLEKTSVSGITLQNPENDYQGMIELIAEDLRHQNAGSIDPLEAVLSIVILEAARASLADGGVSRPIAAAELGLR